MSDAFDKFPDVAPQRRDNSVAATFAALQSGDTVKEGFDDFPDVGEPAASAPAIDAQIKEEPGPISRVLGAAGRGAREALSLEDPLGLNPDTEQNLRDSGFFRSDDPDVIDIFGLFNEIVVGQGAKLGDAALRLLQAPVRAGAAAGGQIAREAGQSQGQAKRLERDLNTLADVGGLVTATVPGASLARRTARRAERRATPVKDDTDVAPESFQAGGSDLAGNINLRNLNTSSDIKETLRTTAEEFANFEGARRGVLSFDDISDLAARTGMTPEKLIARRRGDALNAENLLAARDLLVKSAEDVRSLAGPAIAGSDADKLAFTEAITRYTAVQEQVSGATAEAGRALAQFRILANRGDQEGVRRVLDSTLGGRDKIEDIARRINGLDDEAQVGRFVSNISKPTYSDMMLEAWYSALLSGPSTQSVNVMSNALVAVWSIPEAAVAAGVGRLTGSREIMLRETLARAAGLVQGAKDGIRAGYRAFLTEEPTDLASKLEVRRFRAIPSATFREGAQNKTIGGVRVPLTGQIDIGGKQIRTPLRLLLAGDEFFKAIGFRQELNALAIRSAMRGGGGRGEVARRFSEIMAAPPDKMMRAAKDAAERQTFTNQLGPFGRAAVGFTRDVPALKLVVPFLRTPANIIKFAGARSVFAPLFKEVRENLRGVNGLAARDQQIAQIALGSAVSAAAFGMALEGTITGGGPSDPRERAIFFANGRQPYSIKIGDSFYSYSRFEPLGMLLGIAADASEIAKVIGDEDADKIAGLVVGSISKNLVSKTWLRGPSELIQAVQDPDRYGASYVRNLAGTVVPTGLAQIARAQDPFLREARTVVDQIKSRVPGVRETLPPRLDVFGQPIELEGSFGPDIISPIYQSTIRDDPVLNELSRLRLTVGRVGRSIRGAELTQDEQNLYASMSGQLAKRGLDELVALPQWVELPDDLKAELIRDVFRKSRDMARSQVIASSPDLALRIATARQERLGAN